MSLACILDENRAPYLTHAEHPSTRDKIRPEILSDMLRRVYSDPVDAILRYQVLDPGVHGRHNGGIFGVEVQKRETHISQPALLHIGLIVVVGNEALGVVIRLGGERGQSCEVKGFRCNVGCVGGVGHETESRTVE